MVNLLARASARAQFSRSSPERTGRNFRAQSIPINVIWPNYRTCAISCDSLTPSFFASSHALPYSPPLWGAHRLQFSHATASNIRHFVQLGYPCDFASSREGQSFSTRVRVRQFPSPLENAPVGIFTRDHFSCSSFGLIRVPLRFRAILRWSIF